jgi:Rod binding domain-containing protein
MNTINIFDDGMSVKMAQISKSALQNKAENAAEEFEAFFLTRMMESMFSGISTDGLFGGGHAEKVYRSLLLDEYGKEMAKLGTVGVKDYVMQSILQMQEENSAQGLL